MLISSVSFRKALRTAGHLALVFLATAWMADVRVAAVLVASLIACGLNQLFVVRTLLGVYRGIKPGRHALLLGVIGIAISIIIVLAGYWPMFVILAAGILFVDAVVLRFR